MLPSLKSYFLFIAVCTLTVNGLLGEVRNGYESRVKEMQASLDRLNSLLVHEQDLTLFERASMKNKVARLIEYISYFELTRELLNDFKAIAPAMYQEIDTITDRNGNSITVYVRFVPETDIQHGASGTTNVAHVPGDRSVYLSEYGPNSVSVKIASAKKSLFLLAHEFGHVKYQVRNLATYVDFYERHYTADMVRAGCIGHNPRDLGGKLASSFELRFRKEYMNFVASTPSKPGNPLSMLYEIRRTILRTHPSI